jgi:hypothetical protein
MALIGRTWVKNYPKQKWTSLKIKNKGNLYIVLLDSKAIGYHSTWTKAKTQAILFKHRYSNHRVFIKIKHHLYEAVPGKRTSITFIQQY